MGMLFKKNNFKNDNVSLTSETDSSGMIDAINRSQAVIEFELNGTILNANKNFLEVMGYTFRGDQGESP